MIKDCNEQDQGSRDNQGGSNQNIKTKIKDCNEQDQGSRDNEARSRDQGSRAAINSKDQENIKVGEIRRQQRQKQSQRQRQNQKTKTKSDE